MQADAGLRIDTEVKARLHLASDKPFEQARDEYLAAHPENTILDENAEEGWIDVIHAQDVAVAPLETLASIDCAVVLQPGDTFKGSVNLNNDRDNPVTLRRIVLLGYSGPDFTEAE